MGGLFNREKTNPWIPRAEQAFEKATFDSAANYYAKAIELEPTNNELLIRLATCQKYIGKYDEALTTYEKIVAANPFNYDCWKELAYLYGFAGNYTSAIEALNKLPTLNANPNLLEQKCIWLEHLNKRQEAVKIAENLASSNPKNSYYQSKYASLLLDCELYKEALTAYDNLSRNFGPKYANYSTEAGYCCEMLGDTKGALERYQNLNDQDTGAWCHRARIEESLGLFQEAAASYAKVTCYAQTNCTSINMNRALNLFWGGNSREALTLLEKNMAKGTKTPEMWYLHGTMSLITGTLSRAIESFNAFLHESQGNSTIWYMKGCAEYLAGKYKEALQSFTRMGNLGIGSSNMFVTDDEMELFDEVDGPKKEGASIVIDKLNEGMRSMQANSLYVIGSYSDADNAALSVLSDSPDRTDMQILHARCLINLGRYEDAKDAIYRAINLIPNDYLLQYECGSLEMLIGNYRKAKEIFEILLKNFPGNTVLSRNIIQCSIGLGDLTTAKGVADKLIASTPSDASAFMAAGDAAYLAGFCQDAAHYYESASQIYPELASAYYCLGKAHSATGNFSQAENAFITASQYTQENVGIVRLHAQTAVLAGDYEGALSLYTSIIEQYPNAEGVNRELAIICSELGKWEEAFYYANTAISNGDANFILYSIAGDAAIQLEKYDDAITNYKEALAIRPDNTKISASLGHAYLEINDYQNALTELTAALEKDSTNRNARINRAFAETILNRLDDALDDYNKCYNDCPTDIAILLKIADILEHKKRYDETFEIYKQYLQGEPKDLYALRKLASLYRMKGESEEALKIYNQILEICPSDNVTLYYKEQVLFILGNYDEVIEICEKLLSRSSNNGIHLDYAKSLAYTGKTKEALQEYTLFLKENRDTFSALYFYADLSIRTGNYKKALAAYENIIRAHPNINTAYIERAFVAAKMGDIEQTLTCLKDAATMNQKNPFILSGIAYLYFVTGQPSEAIQYLEKAEECGKSADADLYCTKAFIYLNQNKYGPAEKAATTAVELDKNNALAWNLKAKAEDALGKRKKALVSYGKLVELEANPVYDKEEMPIMPEQEEIPDDSEFEPINRRAEEIKSEKREEEPIPRRKYRGGDDSSFGSSLREDNNQGKNKGKYSGGLIIN